MHKSTPRLTRRHIDGPTRDLLARLSSRLDQARAYDRFDTSRRDAAADRPPARRQDAEHTRLLLSALRLRLRATPARPVHGRDIHRSGRDGEP